MEVLPESGRETVQRALKQFANLLNRPERTDQD
jgi:hypothetical protein